MKIYRSLIIVMTMFVGSCSSNGATTEPPQEDTVPPSAPSDLSASNTTITLTELGWTASTDNIGVVSYSIYQDGQALVSIQSTAHTVNGLTANTNYSFKVKARDAAGNKSAFSNTINVQTDDNAAVLITTTGDIEAYLGDFIDTVPGASGDDYRQPTTGQLNTWNLVIDAILSDDINEAVLRAAEVNCQINEFTDTSMIPNQVFYIVEERSPKSNYWGTYVFSKTPTIDNLVLQAPHIKNDINTGKQAVHCFKNNMAKAVFISGAHRCNNGGASSCSGTTSTCNSGSGPYRISDLAHNTTSVFQKTTENVFNSIANSVFIQLHGFYKRDTDPYVIMSNGTRETPATDYATDLRDALLDEDATLTFKIAHIDTDWNRLIGFTNTQGRLINNSSNPCSTLVTTTTGRFIHIEQERSKLRDNVAGWTKMSNALNTVFN